MTGKHWCIITDRFYPESSGVGNSSLTLAAALVRRGHRVSVLTPRLSSSQMAFETHQGINICRIGGKFLERYGILVYGFYCYFFLVGLARLLFTLRPDYVLGQTAWEGGLLSGVAGLVNRNIVSIVHTHGAPFFANRILALARMAYRLNKVVLVTNNDYADQVKKLAPDVKPKIARNIFVPDAGTETREEARNRYGMNNGKFHVLGIGRMVYERGVETKGFSYAIKAVAEVKNVTLHLFGDGPNRPDYEQMTKSLGADVVFHGFVDKKEIYARMKAGDCLLQSSLNEGVSMVMAEAMAQGLPVITTRTSGALDIIRDNENGIFISTGETGPIIGAIKKLMSDRELWLRLSQNGYRTFEQEFTEEAVVRQYIDAVQGVRK